MNDNRNNQDRPKVDWIRTIITAEDNSTDCLCIQLSELPLFWPRYSVSLGWVRADGSFTPHVPLLISGQGSIHVAGVHDEASWLLQKAREMVHEKRQLLEDERIAMKQAREIRGQPTSSKSSVMRAGKTERDKNKKNRRVA